MGNNQLTIEFYGYQDNVKPTYMDSCVSDANGQIIQKIMADQKNTQMGTDPYSWSCGNVSLYLVPEEQLTWGRWSLVPVAIAKFVTENALKGTQFVLLWHGLGPIGYGQLVASSEAPSMMTDVGVNKFPDPYDKIIESIGLTIEFYGYRGSISPIAMRDCISAASNDVVQHIHEGKGTVKMEAPSYSYSAGEVNLFLIPTEDLTWNMWAFVPVWILEFVTENNFRGAQFILLWEGFGPVGSGQLINTSTDTVSAPRLGVF